MMRACLSLVLFVTLALALAGCTTSEQTAIPTRAAQPSPTATRAPATSTPVPATSTPTPAAYHIEFTGQFQPSLLRVGEKLVVRLGIKNLSDKPITLSRVYAGGPWDKYTVVNVTPAGQLECGLLGCSVYTNLAGGVGDIRYLSIVAYPNAPGNHAFTFAPYLAEGKVVDAGGETIMIGAPVAVTR